jgi:hypothetical protein
VSQVRSPSPAGAGRTVKQPVNVYTVMVLLSFVFLLTGTICLGIELTRWGNFPWWKTTEAASGAPAAS